MRSSAAVAGSRLGKKRLAPGTRTALSDESAELTILENLLARQPPSERLD